MPHIKDLVALKVVQYTTESIVLVQKQRGLCLLLYSTFLRKYSKHKMKMTPQDGPDAPSAS